MATGIAHFRTCQAGLALFGDVLLVLRGIPHTSLQVLICHALLKCAATLQGTLPADGTALLLATMSHFTAQASPPSILCATHCLEVGNPDLMPKCALPRHLS